MKKLTRLALIAITLCSIPLFTHFKKAAPVAKEQVSEVTELDRLLELMSERLELMEDYSNWKWNNTVPIDAPDAEKAQLEAIENPAARLFMERQIEAGKLAQIHFFEQWVVADKPIVKGSVKSPESALIKLDEDLLAQYEKTAPLFKEGDLAAMVEARAQGIFHQIDTTERDLALEGLFMRHMQS